MTARQFTTFVAAAAQLALSFVRERTSESCTRLCAVLCCLTGCGAAVATVAFAFVHPLGAATVGALVGVTSALIGAGCVALLTRTRTPAQIPVLGVAPIRRDPANPPSPTLFVHSDEHSDNTDHDQGVKP